MVTGVRCSLFEIKISQLEIGIRLSVVWIRPVQAIFIRFRPFCSRFSPFPSGSGLFTVGSGHFGVGSALFRPFHFLFSPVQVLLQSVQVGFLPFSFGSALD